MSEETHPCRRCDKPVEGLIPGSTQLCRKCLEREHWKEYLRAQEAEEALYGAWLETRKGIWLNWPDDAIALVIKIDKKRKERAE